MPAYSMLDRTLDAAAALERAVDRRMAPLELTTARYRLLRALRRAEQGPGIFTVSHLAALLMTEPHTVSGMLSRMEASGLVRRETVEGNRRSVYVRLTPEGRKLEAQAAREYIDLERLLENRADLPIDPPFSLFEAAAGQLGAAVAPLPYEKRAEAFQMAGWGE